MIEGVIKTDLTIVPMNNGSILHAYKKTQSTHIDIQEIYFSSIQHESIRAWKCHTEMTINLSVVSGSIKIAMIDVQEAIFNANLNSKMLLQVHDELVFDVDITELEEIKLLIKEKMEKAVKLSVPLDVDLGTGKNWLEAH